MIGIAPVEPYSKVIVKEIIENQQKMKEMKKMIKEGASKGRPVKGKEGAPVERKDGPSALLEKQYERYLKTEEDFVSTSPLKYRRPLPDVK